MTDNFSSSTFFKLSIFFLSIIFISCTDQGNNVEKGELSEKQEEAIEYFKEIALGFEFGGASEVTRKWATDINIFVGGEPSEELQNELDIVINDLNTLIQQDEIQIATTSDSSNSNFYLFFGSGQEFEDRFGPAQGLTDSNYGLFWIYWNGAQQLNSGSMYVDIYRPEVLNQRHLLREELTQSMGLAKDSPKYPNSIFQSSYSEGTATKFSDLDKAIIQLLYHPEMETGLSSSEVDPILKEIVPEIIN